MLYNPTAVQLASYLATELYYLRYPT